MLKKLTRHGNSSALIIDKAVLELLRISINTPLELATDGKSLIVSPVGSARRAGRFHAALGMVNRRHGKTLRKLAH